MIKSIIKKLIFKIDDKCLDIFSKNNVLSNFYYSILSRQFDREKKAVMLGRLEYKKNLKNGQNSVLLRRNIHRLEKGLIMIPRRSSFALSYIGETVDSLVSCIKNNAIDNDEIKWAIDVLREYFDVVEISEKLIPLKEKFEVVTRQQLDISSDDKEEFKPYSQSKLEACNIEYGELLKLFKRRRSTRWYQDKPVDIELVKKAVDAATLAPSACNRQPFEFNVINGNERACEFASCAMGTAGFSKNLQCLIAVVGDLSAYPKERDRHVIYIDSALFTMQFMLALETIGLSSCVINWPDIESNERKLTKKLNLPDYKRVTMLIAVGYPLENGGIPYSHKKSSNQLVKEVN